MKILAKMFVLAVILNTLSLLTSEKANAQNVSVSFQLFYDELSPYGTWVDYPGYGYAWVPSVSGFYPYSTGGYWVNTYYGWTWVSDYSWGWAPFHYGRWDYDPYYGWVWLPGNEWGPAWVVWASNPGYYGWAPMGPGMSISVHYNTTYISHNHWVFVEQRYMGTPTIKQHYAPRSSNVTYLKQSKVIGNQYHDKSRSATYVSGPSRDDVQKATGKQVRTLAVKESSKPGAQVKGNEVNMYRPTVKSSTSGGKRPAPARVSSKEEIKRSGAPNRGTEKSAPATKKMDAPAQRNQGQQKEYNMPRKESPSNQQMEKQPSRKDEGQQKNYNQPKQEPPTNKGQKQPSGRSEPQQKEYGKPKQESTPPTYKKAEPPQQKQERNYQQRKPVDKSQPNRNTGRPKKPNE